MGWMHEGYFTLSCAGTHGGDAQAGGFTSQVTSRGDLRLRCSKAKAGRGVYSTLRVDAVYSADPGVAALVGHHRTECTYLESHTLSPGCLWQEWTLDSGPLGEGTEH